VHRLKNLKVVKVDEDENTGVCQHGHQATGPASPQMCVTAGPVMHRQTLRSIEGEKLMKYMVSFLLGASVGALVALLLAPSSGEELRSNIKTQTVVQAARAREEWQKGVQGVQERVGRLKKEPIPIQEMAAAA
jgi:hypothetical protein